MSNPWADLGLYGQFWLVFAVICLMITIILGFMVMDDYGYWEQKYSTMGIVILCFLFPPQFYALVSIGIVGWDVWALPVIWYAIYGVIAVGYGIYRLFRNIASHLSERHLWKHRRHLRKMKKKVELLHERADLLEALK